MEILQLFLFYIIIIIISFFSSCLFRICEFGQSLRL